MLPLISELGRTKLEAAVSVKSTFSSKLAAAAVVVLVPVPDSTANAKARSRGEWAGGGGLNGG